MSQATPLPGPATGPIDGRMSLGAAVLDDLFPEGEALRRSRRTYIVLLSLAGLIATFGLYADSVAAIIGAMVVAPLGGAIMAVAAALVTGRGDRLPRLLAEAVLGSAWVVAIAIGVSFLIPNPLVLNPSIEARTQPGILDLGVALAAGAAGAYVAVRRTGSDALPGVAIAVSLVPPLATVGICLQIGRYDDAAGALLLFLANFAAIVVIATVVFIIAGAAPSTAMTRERRRLRVGFAIAVIGLILVAVPLVLRSTSVLSSTNEANAAAPIVRTWLDGLQLEVIDYTIDGSNVYIELKGSDQPPAAAPLAVELAKAIGRPVTLTIDYVATSREQVGGTP